VSTAEFQRARQPEQVAARRTTILAAARAMLAERAVGDISLRELSARVGLAKSNVLRYFESRDAIFLDILDEEWESWLDSLEAPDSTGSPRSPRPSAPGPRSASS
jgi:AcrR family transcriptional regulator